MTLYIASYLHDELGVGERGWEDGGKRRVFPGSYPPTIIIYLYFINKTDHIYLM